MVLKKAYYRLIFTAMNSMIFNEELMELVNQKAMTRWYIHDH